jgi:hypothetical protein
MMDEIIQMTEAPAQSRPSPIEFEMAYHARVAIDRIRLPIQHTEQFSYPLRPDALEALDRLERADPRFQTRYLGQNHLAKVGRA